MIRISDNSLWYSKRGVSKRAADGTFILQKKLRQPPTLFGAAAAVVLTTNQNDWFAKKLIESSDEIFTVSAYSAGCPHSTPVSWCDCRPRHSRFPCPAKHVYRQKNYWYYKDVYVYPEDYFVYVPA